MDEEDQFNQFVSKYSHYLTEPDDKQKLLDFGRKLFGESEHDDTIVRPSYLLLQAKEKELRSKEKQPEVKIKNIGLKQHTKIEQPQLQSPESIAEEILILQDRNALLLARRKKLEEQRNLMLQDYGELMEQSVQKKVQLKLDMQNLKAELNEALFKSRLRASDASTAPVRAQVVMEELSELNQQVLKRINSFKMAMTSGTAHTEKAVLDRYSPHMEKILGQIYSYSEYLPVSEVIENFNTMADEVEHETRDIDTQLKNEHERNSQLQKEAKIIEEQIKEREMELNRLKQKNSTLSKEIDLLKIIAENEIKSMKASFQNLLINKEDNEYATPNSARAVVVSTKSQNKKIRRTPSVKNFMERESASPMVPHVDYFVEQVKNMLLDKINRS